MIIIRISGGLGNQMFQYAFGRTLALKNKTNLVFDTSFFSSEENKTQNREFILDQFNTSGRIATKKDFETLGIPPPNKIDFFSKLLRKSVRLLDSIKPIYKRHFFIEENFTFEKKYLNIPNNSFCVGIWQTEKYFSANREILEKELTLKSPLSKKAAEILYIINKSNSVSVHVRRGDYVTNPLTNKKHGVAELNYYDKCINYMLTRLSTAHFFIFSDDIQWVKNNLILPPKTTLVSGNQISNCEELTLMKSCQHNILANSSFSWWAAWLNKNPNKIILVPEKWFATELNTHDLIPNSWLKL